MDTMLSLWNDFRAAHPFWSYGLSVLVGTLLGPFLLGKFEQAIPKIVDWAEARQDRLLDKAGLTPEQKLAVKEHEAKDLEAAAAEIRKQIAEAKTVSPAQA